jgi:hypothetical protein
LLLVPALYAIFALDLKLVKWETAGATRWPGAKTQSQARKGANIFKLAIPPAYLND